jgi:L-asparagine transporter-like permease
MFVYFQILHSSILLHTGTGENIIAAIRTRMGGASPQKHVSIMFVLCMLIVMFGGCSVQSMLACSFIYVGVCSFRFRVLKKTLVS